MGTFSTTITVLSATREGEEQVEALVDTGSTYLWLPRPLLERLGYRSVATRLFTLATGERIQRELTQVNVRMGDETWSVPCVLGDERSTPLLGAMVLEAFGLGVDPVNQRLISVPSLATRTRRGP